MFKFVTGENIMGFILSRVHQPTWLSHPPQDTISLPWRGSVPNSGSYLLRTCYCRFWLVLSRFWSQLILTVPLILIVLSYCLKQKSLTRYYIAFVLCLLLTTGSALSFILWNPCSVALKLLLPQSQHLPNKTSHVRPIHSFWEGLSIHLYNKYLSVCHVPGLPQVLERQQCAKQKRFLSRGVYISSVTGEWVFGQ